MKSRLTPPKAVAASVVSASMVTFVGAWEGDMREPYLDIVGVKTVCYGHTGPDIEDRTYTQEECQRLLMGDLHLHATVMLRYIKVPLTEGEMLAYSSLTYNIGVNAFAKSTLLKLLNAGQRRAACDQLLRFRMAGGKVVRGLVNRRKAEYEFCIGPVYAGTP